MFTPGYFIHEAEGSGWEARLAMVRRGRIFRWREKQTFRFTLSKRWPCTFVQDDGTHIRPCLPGESFFFDFGSIPNFAQSWIRKEGVEYAFHDRAYDVGYLWFKLPGETVWRPLRVTRFESDALLYTMARCSADPRGRFKSGAIWTAVRSGGWACGFNECKELPEVTL
jgi:hypothetical protein